MKCDYCGYNVRDCNKLLDLYSTRFSPSGWRLEYTTMDHTEAERTLYLIGTCPACGRTMRCGRILSDFAVGNIFIREVWEAFCSYRPYEAIDLKTGLYRKPMSPRSLWYRRQDTMNYRAKRSLFVSLFHENDRKAVKRWLNKLDFKERQSLNAAG